MPGWNTEYEPVIVLENPGCARMSSKSGSVAVLTVDPPLRSLMMIFVVPMPAPRKPRTLNCQVVMNA